MGQGLENVMKDIEQLEDRRLMSAVIGAGPTLDPRWFGAKDDGHTDDSTAIQAAINALPATGGTVMLSGYSAVGAGGICLSGRTNVRLTAAAPGDGFIITGVPDPNANYSQNGAFELATIAMANCHSCEVDGLTINANNEAVNPIGVAYSANVVIANDVILHSGFTAAVYAVGNTGDTYSGNTITYSTNYSRGLWIGNAHVGEIETNPVITNNSISWMSWTAIGTMSSGATISGNTLTYNAGSGIALASAGYTTCTNAVVQNNIVEYNNQGIQSDCISDSYSSTNITVTGNTCTYNQLSGIYAVRAINWTITGNNCNNNGVYGITIQAASQITASNNTCSDSRAGSARTQAIGIDVVANGTRGTSQITVLNNQAFNNTLAGIAATTTNSLLTTLTVQGNDLDGNSLYNLSVIPDLRGTINGVSVSSNTVSNGATSVRLLA